MLLILALIITLILGFIFWFIGQITTKQLKINEGNYLLKQLINIGIGASGVLIVVNLISFILKDFNWGLIITFLLIFIVIGWQFKELLEIINYLKSNSKTILSNIRQNTDKYFWILIGIINFVYALVAFSTIKLDRFGLNNSHVYNVNQLVAGTYPPKYSFAPNLAQKYHYGADILGALLSKFSGCHPEISLDILL